MMQTPMSRKEVTISVQYPLYNGIFVPQHRNGQKRSDIPPVPVPSMVQSTRTFRSCYIGIERIRRLGWGVQARKRKGRLGWWADWGG